jgi:hypothetical protein
VAPVAPAVSSGVGDAGTIVVAASIVGLGEGVACVLAVSCEEEQPDCPSSTAALTRKQKIKVFVRYFMRFSLIFEGDETRLKQENFKRAGNSITSELVK